MNTHRRLWTGPELKRLRLTLGFTQLGLARVMGTYPPTISAWERGRVKIPAIPSAFLSYIASDNGFIVEAPDTPADRLDDQLVSRGLQRYKIA